MNDIEASIQSTNGIYRPISFLPLIPAHRSLVCLDFLIVRKDSPTERCSPKISKVFSFFYFSDLSGNNAYPESPLFELYRSPILLHLSKSFDQCSKLKVGLIAFNVDKLSSNKLQRRGRFSTALTDYACSRLKLNRFSLNNRSIIQHAT